MKKWLVVVALSLVGSLNVWSADPAIVPLISEANRISGLNIPFRVVGMTLTNETPIIPELQSGTIDSKDCRIMRDPFIPENFLVRCLRDGTISFRLIINPATAANPMMHSTILYYGPFGIRKMDGLKTAD